MRDVVKLIASIARAAPRARSRLIRQLPWSKMSEQSRAIALKYIRQCGGWPDISSRQVKMTRRSRAVQFLRQYEKSTSGHAGRRILLTLD